jgi:hypothetical protein
LKPLTRDTVDLIISRAERYSAITGKAVTELEAAVARGATDDFVAGSLERIQKLREDTAAAILRSKATTLSVCRCFESRTFSIS